MFGSKKKKFEKAMNRFLTGSTLLKAAVAGDKDTMTAIVTGQTADDEGVWYALETFIMIANRHPAVIARLKEIKPTMPAKAQMAFESTIKAAQMGNPRLFQGGNAVGQGLLIMSLAVAISEVPEALGDAMVTLGEGA